jgi:KipI family sensor histidine kinase inhibitor
VRVLGCGELALLVEFDADDEVLATASAIRAASTDPLTSGPLAAVEELVPAQRTLLIRCSSFATLDAVAAAVRTLRTADVPVTQGDDVDIEVVYDGDDLDDVARLTGRSRDDVIAVHTGAVWTVAFCGFAPGFGYLRAPGDPLEVARRPSPRTRVPTGSVALAGRYSGVYPTPSPGGWQLIGRTDATLWDLARTPPALLVPGTRVHFRDVG